MSNFNFKEVLPRGGGGVSLDTTLTKAGYAADAKAVGDALAVKAEKLKFTNQGIITFGGVVDTSIGYGSGKAHTDIIPISQLANGAEGYCVQDFDDYEYYPKVVFFSGSTLDTFIRGFTRTEIGNKDVLTVAEIKALAPSNAMYVAFNSDFEEEYNKEDFVYVNSVKTDPTLTQAGVPADAKAVGDRLSALGNGAGASGGLNIKTIEFTDRQTAQNWFVENSGKVLKTVIEFLDQRFSFTNITMIDEYDIPSATFTHFLYELDNGNVSIAAIELRITQNGVLYSGGALGNETSETEFPDEYWEGFGFKVTVYYLDESGDDSGNDESYKSFEVPSSFDNNGDGLPETYLFTTALPDKFKTSLAKIEIDAVKDITDENGVYQEPNSHYIKYDEVAAGIGTLPPHVYCYDNSNNYLFYTFEAPLDGMYELAAYVRIKDAQLRGATYLVNEGTDLEHAFVTTYGWDTEEEAFSVRDTQELQGSYMSGMFVNLKAGKNTIRIKVAADVEKNQHFRKLYLVKTEPLQTTIRQVSADSAESIGIGLGKGVIMPDYYDITVTFNNGAPRASDGFCRVITSNGHKMSIQKITLASGQTMPLANETVTLRGKIGCVNSTVNGSIGKEARIFDATIVS